MNHTILNHKLKHFNLPCSMRNWWSFKFGRFAPYLVSEYQSCCEKKKIEAKMSLRLVFVFKIKKNRKKKNQKRPQYCQRLKKFEKYVDQNEVEAQQ